MHQENSSIWKLDLSGKHAISLLFVLVALILYVFTAAPGLTWANQGADGGDLLAAAVTNGVPHPPGYPLYTLLLQLWLAFLGILLPGSDLAWRGNLLSAFCAAVSVGITYLAISQQLKSFGQKQWAALIATTGWMISPLLWGQATITEVYGLHVLLFSALALWAMNEQSKRWWITLFAMFGVAHHLTLLLLLPGALYFRWSKARQPRMREAFALFTLMVIGIVLGLCWHLRSYWVAPLAAPVNWGYVTNWQDFWWLISGQAYRGYLLGASASITFDRVAAWAYILTTQFTPIGLAVALIGLSFIDQEAPRLRNFSLLWILPISIYAILYYTRDSEIYLLPVGWMLTLWLAVGLTTVTDILAKWLKRPAQQISLITACVLSMGIIVLIGWRWSTLSLRHDAAAREFLAGSTAVIEPKSIVISLGDENTFALWYGAWAARQLPADVILINSALYQFDWYRRLLAQRYPDIIGVDQSADAVVSQNRRIRPIFIADDKGLIPADQLIAKGPLWKVKE